jgi:hypothetical protein
MDKNIDRANQKSRRTINSVAVVLLSIFLIVALPTVYEQGKSFGEFIHTYFFNKSQ